MKKLLLCLLFLFIPIYVEADSLTLEELKVKNGELSLPFDSLNNIYTVTLEKDIYSLEFDYKVDENILVFIENNYDLENNSIVTLNLKKEEESGTYYFHILKEEEEVVNVFNEEQESPKENIMYAYKIFIIPTICLILIYITYKIIFRKHKKKII